MRRLLLTIAVVGSVAGGMILQWIFSGLAAGALWMPPLALWAALAWFPALSPIGRLGTGVLAGFFLDAAFLPPFGAHMFLGAALAGVAEILFRAISHRDSPAASLLIVVVLAGCGLALGPLARLLAGVLTYGP